MRLLETTVNLHFYNVNLALIKEKMYLCRK